MKIYLCTSHAPWAPHMSGYRPAKGRLDENTVSDFICRDTKLRLESGHMDQICQILRMAEKYHCTQPCITAHYGAKGKNSQCPSYNSGLRDMTRRSNDGTLAVQFHLDAGARGGRGPLALVNGGDYAQIWAEAFLNSLENLSGIRRRGTAEYNGRHRNGIFDMTEEQCQRDFGYKYFLLGSKDGRQKPCPNAVQVEVGVASSLLDADWLKHEGLGQCAAAAVIATRSTFPLFQKGVVI